MIEITPCPIEYKNGVASLTADHRTAIKNVLSQVAQDLQKSAFARRDIEVTFDNCQSHSIGAKMFDLTLKSNIKHNSIHACVEMVATTTGALWWQKTAYSFIITATNYANHKASMPPPRLYP